MPVKSCGIGLKCPGLAFCLFLLAPVLSLAQTYEVQMFGEVEFNQVTFGVLGNVDVGDSAFMSFIVDATDFIDSPNFPTRGYPISDVLDFVIGFGNGNNLSLQDPFPGNSTPFFVVRDNDPAVDGFFLSTNIDNPFGVPLNQNGQLGQFTNDFMVTYGGDTLASLDVAQAEGIYDFDGLSVFNWTINDGPFNPVGIIFESMSIHQIVIDFPCNDPLGDVNSDGNVNLLDVSHFVEAVLNNTFICEADVNFDGMVDLIDVAPFVSLLVDG